MHVSRSLMAVLLLLVSLSGGHVFAQTDAEPELHIEWQRYYADDETRPLSSGLAWSPDGAYVASANDELTTLSVFSVVERRIVRSFRLPDETQGSLVPFSVRWSPDGDYIALALRRNAYIVDAVTGMVVRQLAPTLTGEVPTAEIMDVQWSNDSQRVAAYSQYGLIWLFDAKTGDISLTIDLNGGVRPRKTYDLFDWSPDNSRFAAYDYDSDAINVWDAQGNKITDGDGCYVGGRTSLRFVDSIAWAHDNVTLMTAGFGLSFCRFENDLLQATDDHVLYQTLDGQLSIIHGIFHADWSPDDRWIVATMGITNQDPEFEYACQLRFFDVTDGIRVVRIDRGMCPNAEWSPDGHYIAGVDGGIWIGEIINF